MVTFSAIFDVPPLTARRFFDNFFRRAMLVEVQANDEPPSRSRFSATLTASTIADALIYPK